MSDHPNDTKHPNYPANLTIIRRGESFLYPAGGNPRHEPLSLDTLGPSAWVMLGWNDFVVAQHKILKAKRSGSLMVQFRDKLEQLSHRMDDFTVSWYLIGMEDAWSASEALPQAALKFFLDHIKYENYSLPYPDECDYCGVVQTEVMLYIPEGEAFNHIVCSAACGEKLLRREIGRDPELKSFLGKEPITSEYNGEPTLSLCGDELEQALRSLPDCPVFNKDLSYWKPPPKPKVVPKYQPKNRNADRNADNNSTFPQVPFPENHAG